MAVPEAPKDKPDSFGSKMDRLIGNIAANRDLGTYETVQISISARTYDKLKVGDHVRVANLKGEPQGAIMLWDDE